MGRHTLDHIAQIDERIDLEVLTRLYKGTQDGDPVCRGFAACPSAMAVFVKWRVITAIVRLLR